MDTEEKKDKLLQLFKDFDKDGDGFLSFDELKNALNMYAEKYEDVEHFSDDQVEIYLQVADSNADGKIDFEEFLWNLDLS